VCHFWLTLDPLWGLFGVALNRVPVVGMSAPVADVKEVVMDVGPALAGMEGGAAKTRRRRGAGRRRTRAAEQVGGGSDVSVEKAHEGPVPVPVPVASPAIQTGGAAKPKPALKPVAAPASSTSPSAPTSQPKVVIAPPKKKPAKLLFVPKSKVAARVTAAKTFKARRVSVTIDNTAKTQKRRKQTMQRVEGMSEDQLRAAAVAAKLSRRETVAKVPADLLRQMLKDYYMMRGMLV
jgi:hypothetical protein